MKFPDAVRDAHLLSGAECWRADAGDSAWAEYGKDKIAFVTCVSIGLKGLHADADSILDQLERDKERQRLYGQKAHGGEGAMDEQGTGERRWRRIPREAFAKLLAQAGELADGDKKHAAFGIFYYGFLTAWHGGEKGKNPVADYALEWGGGVSETYRANGKRGGRPQKATLPENGRVALQNETKNEKERETQPRKPKPKAKAGESEGAAGAGVSGVSGMNENRFRKRGAGGDGKGDAAAWKTAGEAVAGDAREAVWSVADELLPFLAVAYCRDAQREKALGTFKKFARRMGADSFRQAVGRFVHECEAGEMDGVRSRGALLVARLKGAAGAAE